MPKSHRLLSIMLLQVKHSGQLCNRLFSLVPTMAYAIHNKKRLYVLFENQQYLDYFPNIKNSPWVKFRFSKDENHRSSMERATKWLSDKPKKNIGSKAERTLLRLSEKSDYLFDDDLRDFDKAGVFFIDGWKHRYDLSFIEEEKNVLKNLFAPLPDIKNNVDTAFNGWNGVTVGVHVRRGDYKEHLGGKFYFDDETYLTIIQKIRSELKGQGKNEIRFLICSNESFPAVHEVENLFQIAPLFPSDCMTDLYALSRCDYIIGPPSTFSQWASFMGNTPLNVFFGKNDDIKLSDFSPIVRLDWFANNTNYYSREN